MIKSTGYWGKRTPILWKQLNGSKSPPKKQSTEYMRWNRKKKPSFKGKIAWMLLEETKLHWIVSTNHMGPGVSSSRKSSASATRIFFLTIWPKKIFNGMALKYDGCLYLKDLWSLRKNLGDAGKCLFHWMIVPRQLSFYPALLTLAVLSEKNHILPFMHFYIVRYSFLTQQ